MPQEPKKRHSRARQGKRRHAIRLELKSLSVCPNCKSKHVSHTVCPNCGYYKGTLIKTPKTQKEQPAQTPSSA